MHTLEHCCLFFFYLEHAKTASKMCQKSSTSSDNVSGKNDNHKIHDDVWGCYRPRVSPENAYRTFNSCETRACLWLLKLYPQFTRHLIAVGFMTHPNSTFQHKEKKTLNVPQIQAMEILPIPWRAGDFIRLVWKVSKFIWLWVCFLKRRKRVRSIRLN